MRKRAVITAILATLSIGGLTAAVAAPAMAATSHSVHADADPDVYHGL